MTSSSYNFGPWAAEFLANTDQAYEECSRGIAELDRIIVGSPSHLADRTRGYMVMSLYAFWERFFRVAFGEYVRCIGRVQLQLGDVTEDFARICLKRRLQKNTDGKPLHELADKHDPNALRALISSLVSDLNQPLRFDNLDMWVKTDSNVRFEVIEKHCKIYGVDLVALKGDFRCLHTSVEDLVDVRNDIAHGGSIPRMSQDKWEATRAFVLKLIQSLQHELHAALEGGVVRLMKPR